MVGCNEIFAKIYSALARGDVVPRLQLLDRLKRAEHGHPHGDFTGHFLKYMAQPHFLSVLKSLPRLERVVLPLTGWSSMHSRTKILKELPDYVTKEFRP